MISFSDDYWPKTEKHCDLSGDRLFGSFVLSCFVLILRLDSFTFLRGDPVSSFVILI
jgi:hypothetical protein